MSNIAILVATAMVSGVVGYTIADQRGARQISHAPEAAVIEAVPAPAKERASTRGLQLYGNESYAQNYGTTCTTPKGSCQVPLQPLRSPCECDGVIGQVTH